MKVKYHKVCRFAQFFSQAIMEDTDLQEILVAKRRLLERRQQQTPTPAITALADMQQRPHPILNVMTDGKPTVVIGQLRLQETYDPVAAALRYVRAGLDAVALFTDNRIYSKGMDDLLLVSHALKHTPVLTQNYILNKYHVLEARASGASGLLLYSSVMDHDGLRGAVSLAQRLRMNTIVQVENAEQMRYIHRLSPHAVTVGHLNGPGGPATFDRDYDLPLLERLQPLAPFNVRIMPHGAVNTLSDLKAVLALGVDAVVVGERMVGTPERVREMMSQVGHLEDHQNPANNGTC